MNSTAHTIGVTQKDVLEYWDQGLTTILAAPLWLRSMEQSTPTKLNIINSLAIDCPYNFEAT